MKTRIAHVTRPGAASGRTTRHSAPRYEQPSIRAASSSSHGTSRKKFVNAHSVNGIANDAYGRTSAGNVLSKPQSRNHMNNADTTDTSGNIDTLRTANRMMGRPQNWMRARA